MKLNHLNNKECFRFSISTKANKGYIKWHWFLTNISAYIYICIYAEMYTYIQYNIYVYAYINTFILVIIWWIYNTNYTFFNEIVTSGHFKVMTFNRRISLDIMWSQSVNNDSCCLLLLKGVCVCVNNNPKVVS